MLIERLRRRLAREEGFTLIELLVVIVIIGILLAIAVPSYLGFKDRANQKAAAADVRAAMPAIEAYYADCGKYETTAAGDCGPGSGIQTFDLTGIRAYDSGAKFLHLVSIGSSPAQTYCVDMHVSGKTAAATRGAASVQNGDVVDGAKCE